MINILFSQNNLKTTLRSIITLNATSEFGHDDIIKQSKTNVINFFFWYFKSNKCNKLNVVNLYLKWNIHNIFWDDFFTELTMHSAMAFTANYAYVVALESVKSQIMLLPYVCLCK